MLSFHSFREWQGPGDNLNLPEEGALRWNTGPAVIRTGAVVRLTAVQAAARAASIGYFDDLPGTFDLMPGAVLVFFCGKISACRCRHPAAMVYLVPVAT